MTYGTALITGAAIVEYTGVQDLANLAADGELVLNTFALRASDAIYRKLESAGVDPTTLTNENRLNEAVAVEAVGRLVMARYLPGDTADATAWFERVRVIIREEFRPVYADAGEDVSRNLGEGIPVVGNLDARPVYGQLLDQPGTDFYSDDTPTGR